MKSVLEMKYQNREKEKYLKLMKQRWRKRKEVRKGKMQGKEKK